MGKQLTILIVFLTVVVPNLCYAQAPGMKMPNQYVSTSKVIEKRPVILKKYVGSFEAIEQVVSKARISGNITKVAFKEGDLVEKGQLLYEFEDIRYLAAVKSAEANIKQIQARIRYAKRNYERNKELSESKAVSMDETENALSVLDAFEAQLLQAEASLILAQDDLSHTKIYSMIRGRIGRTNFTMGNFITPESGPLVTVIQFDPIYVQFFMSEHDFLDLFQNGEKLKKEAEIKLKLSNDEYYSSNDKPILGKIAFIDNQTKSHTDSIKIWASFENAEEVLHPGAAVSVHLSKTEINEFPAVPISAVMFGKDGYYVYVLDDNNVVSSRTITVGNSDGTYQIIKSGLKPGETVIVGGNHKAIPGATVVPVPTTAEEMKNISVSETAPSASVTDKGETNTPNTSYSKATTESSNSPTQHSIKEGNPGK